MKIKKIKERIKIGIIVIIIFVAISAGGFVVMGGINNSESSVLASVSNLTSKSCYGAIPSNANLCPGDSINLTVSATRALFPVCTILKKCEYTCKSKYVLSATGICEIVKPTTVL